jgi:transposase
MIGRMAAAANEVSTSGLVDTKQSRPARRREWPEELKRQMVSETLEAGSSVSIVARRHDVNANQLFKWRREMLPKEPAVAIEGGPMVPVEIVSEPERRPRRRRMERAGFIEIEFGCGARVCIRGEVAPKTLRQVIELLR